jgi:glucose dehydrogenase
MKRFGKTGWMFILDRVTGKPAKGLHPLISPRSSWLVASVSSARSARLGPPCGAQRVRNSHNGAHGGPIFRVEERPVPKGNVPGEWYSPTQPFPVKPARPLSRVEFNKERDMVRPEDTSAQHVAECQALWDKSGGFANAGAFTPFGFHVAGEPPKSTIQFPGGTGGVNWGGAAVDPTTGYV